MQIRPIIVGTAGHIDHGKSSLVRALTGTDPDRLKEERERGMTIDLGFARFELPDGRTVGIVDVPGHERFIRNMVAGATGTDLVMLVVAADDGVMPQTREHLDIMTLLGLKRGLVALNKIDLVDEDMVELAVEDVTEVVRGTFLEGAPIVRLSATTGVGIDELKVQLARLAEETSPRSAEGVFRLPVQRVFSKRGFGTVVTGIPVSGAVRTGDVLEVLPAGVRAKVRGIHAYSEATETGRAGHSMALNLTDLDRARVTRGDVVATPGFFSPVRMVGVRLRVLPSLGRPVTNRMAVRLHTGTADALGEAVLLDREELAPGEEGLLQVRLSEPVVCAPGDPFILRLASPAQTLGGGVILEESRHRLKRFKGFVIEELSHQESSLGSPGALLESTLARLGLELTPVEVLAKAIKRTKADTESLLSELAAEGRAATLGGPGRWIHVDRLQQALTQVRGALEAWFAQHGLRAVMEVLELRRVTGFEAAFLAALLDWEQERGELVVEPGGRVRPQGREVELDPETSQQRDRLQAALLQHAFGAPTAEDLAGELDLTLARTREVLALMVDQGAARDIGKGRFLSARHEREAEQAITSNCERNDQLEIPELRDALQTTRKFLIPLLEYFDAKGVTLRQGPTRVLKRT